MVEPTEEKRDHDTSIADLVKMLINGEVAVAPDAHGDTQRDKLRNHFKARANDTVMGSIAGLSAYLSARAAERQAVALETLAKVSLTQQRNVAVDTDAQAMVDQRESKRDYLATTYSLPFDELVLLWAIRGMLMDASVKSLSKPDRFDPYRRVTTEEIAWSLRMMAVDVWEMLPRTANDEIDYVLLEEFDIMRYGGTDDAPDDWMYGG